MLIRAVLEKLRVSTEDSWASRPKGIVKGESRVPTGQAKDYSTSCGRLDPHGCGRDAYDEPAVGQQPECLRGSGPGSAGGEDRGSRADGDRGGRQRVER